MNKLIATFMGLMLTMAANAEDETGIIGRAYEDGMPVIYAFVNEMPEDKVRSSLTWLTIISWEYDGSSNNGMPLHDDNQGMIAVEDAIEELIENGHLLRHAYSRTGNNLKELCYYINDQDQFLKALNKSAGSTNFIMTNMPHSFYEITFHRKSWKPPRASFPEPSRLIYFDIASS